MLLDERQLVSATELNRNPSRFVSLASKGHRQVVLQNNVPVAALISMEDLRRLDALDRVGQTPSLAESLAAHNPAETTSGGGGMWTQPNGTTVLGHGQSGPPVTVPLCANHFYIGQAPCTELELIRSAAITGALPAPLAQFWVLTAARVARLVHALPEHVVVKSHSMAGKKSDLVFQALDEEIDRRNRLLDRYGVNTIDEARAAMSAACDEGFLGDLILIGEDLDDKWERLARYLPTVNTLGIYVWAFAEGSVDSISALPLQHFRIRVAARTSRDSDSRLALGTTDAKRLQPGWAMLVDTEDSDQRQPRPFQITAATTLDRIREQPPAPFTPAV